MKAELIHDDFGAITTSCRVAKLEDITEQKIKFALNKVWPGHGFAEPDSFKTVDSAIEYCLKVESSCDEKLTQSVSELILVNAASLLRRHHISQVIKAMIRMEPIETVRDKCCTAFKITIPEFYALKNLSDAFTEQEVFFFGMHGGSFTQIKTLAMVEDDNTRKLIFTKYCDKVENPLDAHQRASANKLLNQAVSISITTTPALMEGDTNEVDENGEPVAADPLELIPEQLQKARDAVKKFTKVVALVSPGTCAKTQEALEGLHMHGIEAGTAAEQYALQTIEETGILKKDIDALLERITDVKQEVDSVVAAYSDGIHGDNSAKAE